MATQVLQHIIQKTAASFEDVLKKLINLVRLMKIFSGVTQP